MVYTDDLRNKDEKIDKAIEVLKKEFIGIDEQIEGILNNMRTWYLYPDLQDRPLVISLWGLTGVGKTCVVKRIAELLDIEKDMVYFNFAEIGECTSWEIENKLEEELSNDKSNRMFIYDEFQYAATLDAMGNEKDKKSGLKPFWELLDNGRIHKRDNFWAARQMHQMLRYFIRINDYEPMKIVDGVWVNAEQCLKGFTYYEKSKFKNYFQWEEGDVEQMEGDFEEDHPQMMTNERYESLVDKNSNNTFFIRQSYIEKLMNLLDQNGNTTSDILDFHCRLTKMGIDEIIDLIDSACDNAMKGYDLDFKNSIIFVIGNLDEAYEMALDVDPDMSPDQFHKATKNITIVDIKKALQQRFRNEQIARLGNIHVIYPSFTSDTFRKIISLTLNNYAKDVFKLTGYKLTYDKSLIDIIYKDAVFPTHGTRPIFSSVHEFVKSKFPIIVHDVALLVDGEDDVEINYSFKRKNTIVRVYNQKKEVIYERKFKEKLRLESLRKSTKDEEQAMVAVHESGHFVMYAKLNGKMPEKLCSRTIDKSTGGFLLKDTDDYNNIATKEELMNDIKIALGGYVAETTVFGYRNISSGAQGDLRTATRIASRIVREYGMDNFDCAVTTYLMNAIEDNEHGGLLFDANINDTNNKIKRIIGVCRDEVQATFKDEVWKNMLKKSAEYLAVHSSMPKNKMNELYDEIPDEYKVNDNNDSFYRDKLKNF